MRNLGMALTGAGTLVTLTILPVLGQIDPVTASGPVTKALGSGTAQMVLSVVCLGLASAFVWLGRRYISDRDCERDEMRKVYQGTIDRQTQQAKECHDTQDRATEAIHRLSAVIEATSGQAHRDHEEVGADRRRQGRAVLPPSVAS